ncbi:hypothetical protein IC235_03385 [Hymenobacter sp. BT664]|uniref:Uncharacterized protein n=1 Tax=Hymenobacter montanus TaxID=2771359 RepID=A0A927BBF1_9BACT|nr:hypothetical protein [Hymenobacter montanus]
MVFLLVLLGSLTYYQLRPFQSEPAAPLAQVAPDTAGYPQRLRALAQRRTALATRYQQADTGPEKAALQRQARQLLITALHTDIWPTWYGTPWAFYGTTQTPQRGSIACGYFVTTTLRDAGIRLERVALAKTTSESLVKNLTDEAHIHRYSLVPQRSFVQQVQQLGDGLYVVGLDFHVGFLLVDKGEVRFIHSTYLGESTVVDEEAATAPALRSNYRVVGCLSADPHFIESWLKQKQFVYPAPKSRPAPKGKRT